MAPILIYLNASTVNIWILEESWIENALIEDMLETKYNKCVRRDMDSMINYLIIIKRKWGYTPNSDWLKFVHQYLKNEKKCKILDNTLA